MEPIIGQIMLFAGSFAPRGWAFCDGQLIEISQNEALFAILGVTYGGDGRTTFALPDLRDTPPVHAGLSPDIDETTEPQADMQPSLCINYIIALQGIFPSRS